MTTLTVSLKTIMKQVDFGNFRTKKHKEEKCVVTNISNDVRLQSMKSEVQINGDRITIMRNAQIVIRYKKKKITITFQGGRLMATC